MVNKQLYELNSKNIKIIYITLGFLFFIGFLMQYSSSGGEFGYYAYSYLIKLVIGLIILYLFSKLNLQFVYNVTPYVYWGSLFLLALVPLIGETRLGAQRWINVGGLGILYFQPSEVMKIALVLMLSRHFHKFNISSIGKFRFYILPILFSVVPFLLIAIQPDLGTALIILIVACLFFFNGGFKIRYFVMVGVLALITAPIMWFNFMHDYQKKRIITFLDPTKDSRGSGYHIIQSKIAIGAGGFSGAGYLNGTQGQLDFLPEKHSDFIFTLYAEEFGFLGVMFLILLYSVLILMLYNISANSYYLFNKFLASGSAAIIFIYTFINIGMVSGLLPVVGVPLPFLSFGGTSLVTLMILIGLTVNVAKNEGKDHIETNQ